MRGGGHKKKSTRPRGTHGDFQRTFEQGQLQGRGQRQVEDSQRLLAINSLDLWRTSSMDASTELVRNNRRGNETQPPNPQRRPSGINTAQQTRKAGKTIQSIIKPVAIPQNGPLVNQPANKTTPPPVLSNETSEQFTVNTFGFDPTATIYKPDPKLTSTVADRTWSAKASTMANGKDFWFELRKQVAALQQSGGTAQGG